MAVIAIVPSVSLAAHGARVRELLDQAARDQRCEQRLAGDGARAGRQELLTARELEVLALIARRRANKAIAFDLGVAEKTVKTHEGVGAADRQARARRGDRP